MPKILGSISYNESLLYMPEERRTSIASIASNDSNDRDSVESRQSRRHSNVSVRGDVTVADQSSLDKITKEEFNAIFELIRMVRAENKHANESDDDNLKKILNKINGLLIPNVYPTLAWHNFFSGQDKSDLDKVKKVSKIVKFFDSMTHTGEIYDNKITEMPEINNLTDDEKSFYYRIIFGAMAYGKEDAIPSSARFKITRENFEQLKKIQSQQNSSLAILEDYEKPLNTMLQLIENYEEIKDNSSTVEKYLSRVFLRKEAEDYEKVRHLVQKNAETKTSMPGLKKYSEEGGILGVEKFESEGGDIAKIVEQKDILKANRQKGTVAAFVKVKDVVMLEEGHDSKGVFEKSERKYDMNCLLVKNEQGSVIEIHLKEDRLKELETERMERCKIDYETFYEHFYNLEKLKSYIDDESNDDEDQKKKEILSSICRKCDISDEDDAAERWKKVNQLNIFMKDKLNGKNISEYAKIDTDEAKAKAKAKAFRTTDSQFSVELQQQMNKSGTLKDSITISGSSITFDGNNRENVVYFHIHDRLYIKVICPVQDGNYLITNKDGKQENKSIKAGEIVFDNAIHVATANGVIDQAKLGCSPNDPNVIKNLCKALSLSHHGNENDADKYLDIVKTAIKKLSKEKRICATSFENGSVKNSANLEVDVRKWVPSALTGISNWTFGLFTKKAVISHFSMTEDKSKSNQDHFWPTWETIPLSITNISDDFFGKAENQHLVLKTLGDGSKLCAAIDHKLIEIDAKRSSGKKIGAKIKIDDVKFYQLKKEDNGTYTCRGEENNNKDELKNIIKNSWFFVDMIGNGDKRIRFQERKKYSRFPMFCAGQSSPPDTQNSILEGVVVNQIKKRGNIAPTNKTAPRTDETVSVLPLTETNIQTIVPSDPTRIRRTSVASYTSSGESL